MIYLCSRILLFVPFGFYIAMIARRQSRLLKFAFLLLFPLVLEIAQYFVYPARCDIDDVIYGLLGGLLGSLGFFLQNLIFKSFSGKDFLAKDPAYRFSNSSLHF
jgi:glycopeptide antibiotics resistance protein